MHESRAAFGATWRQGIHERDATWRQGVYERGKNEVTLMKKSFASEKSCPFLCARLQKASAETTYKAVGSNAQMRYVSTKLFVCPIRDIDESKCRGEET